MIQPVLEYVRERIYVRESASALNVHTGLYRHGKIEAALMFRSKICKSLKLHCIFPSFYWQCKAPHIEANTVHDRKEKKNRKTGGRRGRVSSR